MRQLILVILDGWGIGKNNAANPIFLAKTPFYDECWNKYPTSILECCGEAVGLLPGQIGSSEVGHMHIGAGRIVLQELTKLHRAMADGSFFNNPVFKSACKWAKEHQTKLHLIGLVSSGGVHSHLDHLLALIRLAREQEVKDVAVHAFLDGRDTPPASAGQFLETLARHCSRLKTGVIASLCGRYIAMDRDNNWELTAAAADLLTQGHGQRFSNFNAALRHSYDRQIFDEYLEPVVLDPGHQVAADDAIIFFNFRADRMRQLSELMRQKLPAAHIVSMIPYGTKMDHAAYDRLIPRQHLTSILSQQGVSHLKVAETQKYAHLTYFFNGGQETRFPLEDRILIPSPKIKNFAQAPELRAKEITTAIISNLRRYPVIIANYANPDMVGHTGDLGAAMRAAVCVDQQLTAIVKNGFNHGYDVIVTADHGNLESVYDAQNNAAHTAHTTNPVPFILISPHSHQLKTAGGLDNIAPTVLELLDLPRVAEMSPSLLVNNF